MHFNKKMLTANWAGLDQIEANFLVRRTNPTLKKRFLTIFIFFLIIPSGLMSDQNCNPIMNLMAQPKYSGHPN
jgi:hypothetical protein